jgi:hypothetical protein
VTASGGKAPYRFQIDAGALPPGLTMNLNGVIKGKPTTPGTYLATIFAFDDSNPGNEGQNVLSITIS